MWVTAVLAASAGALVVGLAAGYALGRRAGRVLMDRQLAEDPAYRQVVLARLARLEGAKVELQG